MDRGAWRATVHGATKSQTGLSDRGLAHSPDRSRVSCRPAGPRLQWLPRASPAPPGSDPPVTDILKQAFLSGDSYLQTAQCPTSQ